MDSTVRVLCYHTLLTTMSTTHDVEDNGLSKLKEILKEDETVPFLKTCPDCNEPLRSEKNITVVMESVNANDFTDITYYCESHEPDLENLDNILAVFAVLIDFTIIEPHPNCNPSERQIQVNNIESKLPSSYDI